MPIGSRINRIWKKYHRVAYRGFLLIIGNRKDSISRNLFRLFQFSIYAVSIVFLLNLIPVFFGKTAEFGGYGDFFGGVLNPILTFLTFMGLLITIVLQQKELREARHEFEGQKDALRNQQKEMVKQTFDNRFFQMLNSFNKVRESINTIKTFSDLKMLIDLNIDKRYYHGYIEYSEKSKDTELSKFKDVYKKINDESDGELKYYFINLYQLLDYVDRETPKSVDSKKYTNIIRAQLSKNELVFLFFNAIGIIDISGEKFKTLIETYSLLEHLKFNDLNISSGEYSIEYKAYVIYVYFLILCSYSEGAYGKNTDIILQINSNKERYKKVKT